MRHLIITALSLAVVSMIWLLPPRHTKSPVLPGLESQCPTTPLAVCFAEGTDPDYMADWTRRILDRQGTLDFNLEGRWQSTANGGTGSQGTGVALTYSFVPDGVSIEGDQSVLFARMNQIFPNQQAWQNLFAQVFARWGEVTGNSYTQVTDDGAGWGQGSPGVIGQRGDIRIAMTPMDGENGVLAYNFFPDRGDMVLDEAESWNSAAQNYRFIRNIVAHEHGHGLGLAHVCPINTTKLLEPTYTSAFDGPQHDDILAGQRGYGDPYEPNDASAESYDLGQIEGTETVTLASLDDNTDTDWWRFTIVPNRSVSVTLEPDGRTYLEGQQNFDGSCEAGTSYSTYDDQNLNFTLQAANGTTLATENGRPVGQSETLYRLDVPAGITDLRLLVDGATNNAIQPYRLTIESIDPATPYLLSCPLEIDTALIGQQMDGALVLTNPPLGGVLMITNISVSGPFTVSPQDTVLLEPNDDLVVTVTFHADELGPHSGVLTVFHNGPGDSLTCDVSSFAATSSIVFLPSAVADFGDIPLGTLDSALVGIRAQGNVPLTITSINTQAPFMLAFDGPVSLEPGPLLRVYPRVIPSSLGEHHGWMIIHHSATTSPDSVELIYNGTPSLNSPTDPSLPRTFALNQNFPNPFNPTTTIGFDLPQSSPVELGLYNIQGQLVKELLSSPNLTAGRHSVELDASPFAAGIYIYRLEAGNFVSDRKLVYLK
ncbi:MAG: matrixin family metalloprotease [bacterium]|nr:matrixin family metalloprotease [bacterium]